MKLLIFILLLLSYVIPLYSNEPIIIDEGNYWIGATLQPTSNEISYWADLTYNINKTLFSLNYFYKSLDKPKKSIYFDGYHSNTSEYSALIGIIVGDKKARLCFKTGIGYYISERNYYEGYNPSPVNGYYRSIVEEDFCVPVMINLLFCYTNWIGFGMGGYVSLNNIENSSGFGISVIFGKLSD